MIVDMEQLSQTVRTYIFTVCKSKFLLQCDIFEIINSFAFTLEDSKPKFVQTFMAEKLDLKDFGSTREEYRDISIVLQAIIVYYLSLLDENVSELFNTIEELIAEYPSFCPENRLGVDELRFLLMYRNMMVIALTIIPAKENKHTLMSICSLLEGSGRSYPTEGNLSGATLRRVMIYELESNCFSVKRPRKKCPKTKIICTCGASIFKRTLWKHCKSLKHFLKSTINT